MDHHLHSHVSKEGESTPRVLDNMIHDSQRVVTSTSSYVMEDCIPLPKMPSTFRSSLVNDSRTGSSTASSSVTEPAQKRQRGPEGQFDEGNRVGKMTGEAFTISCEAELTLPLECDPALRDVARIQPSIEGGTEGGTSEIASAPCGDTQVTAPPSITYEAQTISVDPPFGEQPPLPRTRLLIFKKLT